MVVSLSETFQAEQKPILFHTIKEKARFTFHTHSKHSICLLPEREKSSDDCERRAYYEVERLVSVVEPFRLRRHRGHPSTVEGHLDAGRRALQQVGVCR